MPRVRVAAVPLFAVLALAGCTADEQPPDPDGSIAATVYPGTPAGVEADAERAQTTAVWLGSADDRFAIITWGSSSCPPVASELTATSANALTVAFGEPVSDLCTDDMAPTTHEFDLPAEISERPVAVEVLIQGYDGLIELTLP